MFVLLFWYTSVIAFSLWHQPIIHPIELKGWQQNELFVYKSRMQKEIPKSPASGPFNSRTYVWIIAHLSNINLLLELPGSGSVIGENGCAITVLVPEMISHYPRSQTVVLCLFLFLPVDKLNSLLQGVGIEDAEHWTEDLILVSLHTWQGDIIVFWII